MVERMVSLKHSLSATNVWNIRGYEPVPGDVLEELKAYGVLLTSESILFKKQNIDDEYSHEAFVEFEGIWKIRNYLSYLKAYYYWGPAITIDVKDYTTLENRRLTLQVKKAKLQENEKSTN